MDSYKDWQKSSFNVNGSHALVPDSCCKEKDDDCGDFRKSGLIDVDKTKIYTDVCTKC